MRPDGESSDTNDMSSNLAPPGGDRSERLGRAVMIVTQARHRHDRAQTAAGAARYVEPLLIPAAAGVWLYALLGFVSG